MSLDMRALPPFWLAYLSDPSDSGRIHSNIRQRWLGGTSAAPSLDLGAELVKGPFLLSAGEPLVVEAMRTFAELTDAARWERL